MNEQFKSLSKKINAYFQSHLFESKDKFKINSTSTFILPKINFYDSIECVINRYKEMQGIVCGLYFDRKILLVEDLWLKYRELLFEPSHWDNSFYTFQLTTWNKDHYPAAGFESWRQGYYIEPNEESVLKFIEAVKDLYDNTVFPFAEKCRDIRVLNEYINSPVDYNVLQKENRPVIFNNEGFYFRKMIIAYLSDNKEFELVCDYVKQMTTKAEQQGKEQNDEYLKNWPLVFEKIYADLKEMKPLKNFVLD